jgi:lysophospholipase L1-like esterase
VRDALEERPDLKFDSLTDPILGLPGLLQGVSRSQVEWAEALQPTTIIIWIGANDTLGAALSGDASLVTPDSEFTAAYIELMDRLAATGAALVVANLPDPTVIPYLTSAEQVASTIGLPAATIAAALGIQPGDFVTPDAFPIIREILTGAKAGPLAADVVLDAGEITVIRAATTRFNAFIATKAAEKGAALVDTHALLNSFQSKGLVVRGQRLNTSFLGGIFSLDGFHPTNTAAAKTANAFIKVMNRQLRAGIAPVNIRHIAAEDPLVLPGVGQPPSRRRPVDPETGRSMRRILAPR